MLSLIWQGAIIERDKYMKALGNCLVIVVLLFTSAACYGQSRQEKTQAIIKKMGFIGMQRSMFKSQVESIKRYALESDSTRIAKLEQQLSDDEGLTKRIEDAFNEMFSDEEIGCIYTFTQTTAFNKLNTAVFEAISSRFTDISDEIAKLKQYN